MVKGRKKVGILFSYSEGWIGGSYYFINLVYALKQLTDAEKPDVVIVSDSKASFEIIKETGYPYLSYINSEFYYSFLERCLNKLSRIIFDKNIIIKTFRKGTIDVLFGYYEQLFRFERVRKIYWIPDLQDKYYPEYLGQDVASGRKILHEKLAYSKSEILFSSKDAKKDFEKFYPSFLSKNYVVNFAVTLPDFSSININDVLEKYKVSQPYFFSPNQFWSHKNHLTVIKAIEALKKRGISVKVLFTGNEKVGGGEYANMLKEYVKNAALEENCLFLGFIDRKEQLALLNDAFAVIQPSMFEGWSTVVEDAKSLGKYLILSDILVHHEQIADNVSFFKPTEVSSLTTVIEKLMANSVMITHTNYDINLKIFAEHFINAVKE